MDSVNHLPSNRAHTSVSHQRAKSRQFAMLSVQAIRHFPSLNKACTYLNFRMKSQSKERFMIQQVTPNKWAVCRVLNGGVM